MSDNIKIQRDDGGILLPSVTWREVNTRENGITAINVVEGSGPSFAVDKEMPKLRGVKTNYGTYKEHSIVQGAPGIYDRISIAFQELVEPPVYIYDFSASVISQPLASHPGYKTYWDHNLVATEGAPDLSGDEFNVLQAVTDGTIPNPYTDLYEWRKSTQAIGANDTPVSWNGLGNVLSGHYTADAKMAGITSCKIPSVTVTETIYFLESKDFSFTLGPIDISYKNLNSKTVASMSGKAGWPLHNTFGYPRDAYALINDPVIYDLGGKPVTTDYSDYRKVGLVKTATSAQATAGEETVTPVVVNEAFMKKRGIPITQYITPFTFGMYNKNKYGHPLWLCSSASVKRVGYWFEATLKWDYYGFGILPDLYPLATARINGLA